MEHDINDNIEKYLNCGLNSFISTWLKKEKNIDNYRVDKLVEIVLFILKTLAKQNEDKIKNVIFNNPSIINIFISESLSVVNKKEFKELLSDLLSN